MCIGMKVYFERTGGFAGMKTSVALDTEKMVPSESEKLHGLCNNIDFLKLPQKTETKSGAADTFHYKITIESDNGKRTIETSEMSMTPEFEDFVNFLSEKALQ